MVYTHSNIGRLYGNQLLNLIAIQVLQTDILQYVSAKSIVVGGVAAGDFSQNHDIIVFNATFCSDSSLGIVL